MVGTRDSEPGRDHFQLLLGELLPEVVHLGAVRFDVIQLPLVLHEVTFAGERAVTRHRLPAFVVDGSRPEHGVVLCFTRSPCLRISEGVTHRNTLNWRLLESLDRTRRFDATTIEDRRYQIDAVMVLITHASGDLLHLLWPGNNQWIRHATLKRVTFKHLVRSVEGPGPSSRVMRIRIRTTQQVDLLQILLKIVRPVVEELVFIDGALRTTFAARPVIRHNQNNRVFELAGLLQIIDQPSQFVIGVAGKACVVFSHTREQSFLIGGE